MKISIFDIISMILLILPVFACLYYWLLALYTFTFKSENKKVYNEPVHSFAIVIPAHNEETVISKTLESCLKLDYPSDKFNIYVIADNCTDHTAMIVNQYGVNCYERHNDIKIGKGFALSWAFERILPEEHDCFLIIDADCTVEPHALRVFDQYFQGGDCALQANDVSSNPDDSPMSYAVAVGNVIENDLFYAPKSKLGLSVFLRGTGMVFHRDTLLQFPWTAHSVAEDVEYTLNLIRHDVKIQFVQNVKVRSAFPATPEQLNVQRTRWASGNLSFAKKQTLKLLIEGVVQRNIMLMDAGCTFLVLSRPLVISASFLACVASYANWLSSGSLFSAVCLGSAVTTLFCLIAYFSLGIIILGITWNRLNLLLLTPFVVFRLIVISIINLIGVKGLSWKKTPR